MIVSTTDRKICDAYFTLEMLICENIIGYFSISTQSVNIPGKDQAPGITAFILNVVHANKLEVLVPQSD